MIDIVVVDDHAIVLKGIAALLNSYEDLRVVGEASTGSDAVLLCRKCKPDVVIMDYSMPGFDGADASRKILEDDSSIKILGLSMYADPSFVDRMLKSGASGYLLKNAQLSELRDAILSVANGSSYLSPKIAETVLSMYVRGDSLVKRDAACSLSKREQEILQMVADGRTSKEISTMLNISVRTVEKHRMQIMKRLKIDNTAAMVKYAIKSGFTTLD